MNRRDHSPIVHSLPAFPRARGDEPASSLTWGLVETLRFPAPAGMNRMASSSTASACPRARGDEPFDALGRLVAGVSPRPRG